MDIDKIASSSASDSSDSDAPRASSTKTPTPDERLVVYIDESYSDEFPRKPDGSLAYAALIIPESQVDDLDRRISQILAESYRGRPAAELKYNKISKRPALLQRIGSRIVTLLADVPGARLLGIYIPQGGYFGEKRRSIAAVSHYGGTTPSDAELRRVDSAESVRPRLETCRTR